MCGEDGALSHVQRWLKTRHKETIKCRSYLSGWWVNVDITVTMYLRRGKGLFDKG